jgi:hypothetical protein
MSRNKKKVLSALTYAALFLTGIVFHEQILGMFA